MYNYVHISLLHQLVFFAPTISVERSEERLNKNIRKLASKAPSTSVQPGHINTRAVPARIEITDARWQTQNNRVSGHGVHFNDNNK